MAAHVGSPDDGGSASVLTYLGGQRQNAAGTYTVTPPAGAAFMRITLKGAGGAGGPWTGPYGSSDQAYAGNGGGEGATARSWRSAPGAAFSIIVGAGGSGTTDGAATTALGLTAAGGKTGTDVAVGAGGVGTNASRDPGFGADNFSGQDGQSHGGGGDFGGSYIYHGAVSGDGAAGRFGGGGTGALNYNGSGLVGGDGFFIVEFFG
jgi:hypothetical protein